MGIIPKKECFKDPSQLIKFIILFICGIFTFIQVAQCIQKLIYPPASTYTEFVLNNSIRYPCLTICRRPAYKTELFKIFRVPPTASIDGAFTFRHFNFSRYTLSDFLETTTYNFNEIFGQYAYATKGNSLLQDGPNLRISSSFHLKRGRCFTFQPLSVSNTFSIYGGYVFYLFHNMSNFHMNEFGVSTHGFQIYLHDPNEAVTYDDDEKNNFLEYIDLEAGEDMRVKFAIQEFGRVPTKDNYCIPNTNYSKSQCEEHCVNEQIAIRNNCTAPFLKLPPGHNFQECSSPISIRYLIRDYNIYRETLVKNCNCPMACNFTVYQTSIINRRNIENALRGNSMICLYCTNLFFRMSEVLGYDWNQFISDIGGSLGFLLGLSVISVICLCEEIFQLIFRWMFKNKNRKAQREIEPNNSQVNANDKHIDDEIKANEQHLDKQDVSHEYTNLNKLANEFIFYKKDSELSPNTNNLKY